MGEVLRHRGGFGAAGRRPVAAAEPRLRGAGVDFPAPGRDRAEAPARLRRELRAPPQATELQRLRTVLEERAREMEVQSAELQRLSATLE